MDPHSTQMLLSGAIFVAAYGLIIWDKIDRTLVALSGAVLMIVTRVLSQDKAFVEIDYNTLGLLVSMMVIVMILKRTGVFEYLAVKTVKAARAEPWKILLLLSLTTGIISALLDNVTTILLVLPLTLSIARDLHINPFPLIVSEVFASNVGGTATLIGDPPNIMIGSFARLNFMDFIRNETAVVFGILVLSSLLFVLVYRKRLSAKDEAKAAVLGLDENGMLRDKKLLVKSLAVLALITCGFLLHGALNYESGTVAMAGAVVLLLVSKVHMEKTLKEIEWKTILFFIGMFILVGGIKQAGLITLLSQYVLDMTHGNLTLTALVILWVSAVASAFIDNIPYVATMLPLIQSIGTASGMNINPLWWALSLGACLGGNGTVIGASANVVASSIAEEHGHKITFRKYFAAAFPMMILTVVCSTAYLFLAYLI